MMRRKLWRVTMLRSNTKTEVLCNKPNSSGTLILYMEMKTELNSGTLHFIDPKV